MSISNSDIKWYKATTNTDAVGNGGRISTTQATSGVANNVFPNVTNAERTAGLARYRKVFFRNENTGDLTLENLKVFIGTPSTAADYFVIKEGTDTDTQSAAGSYTNWSGAGILDVSVASGETSIDVDYSAVAATGKEQIFNGAYIRLDDGTNIAHVQVNGAPSWNGNVATLAISGDLTYNWSDTTTVVSSYLNIGDVNAATGSWVETSSTGTYNEATYPVTVYNKGTVTDNWTLTFSSSSEFSATGAVTGSVGSGEIGTNFQPQNGSSYYFRVRSAGWGGTWALGDTVTFTTTHSGKAIWFKEVVPAGIASYSNNTLTAEWSAESA